MPCDIKILKVSCPLFKIIAQETTTASFFFCFFFASPITIIHTHFFQDSSCISILLSSEFEATWNVGVGGVGHITVISEHRQSV